MQKICSIFTLYFYIHDSSQEDPTFKNIYMFSSKMRRQNTPTVYEVQTILDECVMNYQMHYLIKWKNCDHSHDSWQPVSNLRPILSYLKYWIKKRQAKNEQRRNEKCQDYKSIKPFLYNGQLLSRKKSKHAKISEQILNRQKTWEKYYDRAQVDEQSMNQQERFIRNRQQEVNQILSNNPQKSEQIQEDIYYEDEQGEESGKSHSQQEYKSNDYPKNINEQLNDTFPNENHELPKTQPKNTTEMTPQQQNKRHNKQKNKTKQKSDDNCFHVVGSIDMKHIVKIVRTFIRGNTRILEVQMRDGKLHFTKAEQVQKANSKLLIQFYEDHNIKF